jgi:hypothetical protein
MTQSSKLPSQDRDDERAGLCARCVHVQVITSARGSRFYLCRLSFKDDNFPRYPILPVLACSGFVDAQHADGR